MLFRYISLLYVKYFFIILVALSLFVVGFDYLANSEKLALSANLTLIYLVYKTFYAIDLLLPLSLVFAMIGTKAALLRSNSLVAIYSLGYSKRDLLKPFISISLLITTAFILLHNISNFARADEFAKNIKNNSSYLNPSKDLFFVYQDKFIYFANMLPLQEVAKDIRVFSLKDSSLKEVLEANEARFIDNHWHIKQANIIKKPDIMLFDTLGIEVDLEENLNILEGFRPKMLDQIHEGKVNFSIKDAIDAYNLLKNENINIDTIKSALYKIFIHPFFAPLLIILLFNHFPLSLRFANISLVVFVLLSVTLIIWALLFILIELSNNKTISSEIAIIIPIIILLFISTLQLANPSYKQQK